MVGAIRVKDYSSIGSLVEVTFATPPASPPIFEELVSGTPTEEMRDQKDHCYREGEVDECACQVIDNECSNPDEKEKECEGQK